MRGVNSPLLELKMPKIKMNETKLGANDGVTVIEYKAGNEYILTGDLYEGWKSQGVCSDVESITVILSEPEQPEPEQKTEIAAFKTVQEKHNKTRKKGAKNK